jgi:hypothetical protein
LFTNFDFLAVEKLKHVADTREAVGPLINDLTLYFWILKHFGEKLRHTILHFNGYVFNALQTTDSNFNQIIVQEQMMTMFICEDQHEALHYMVGEDSLDLDKRHVH